MENIIQMTENKIEYGTTRDEIIKKISALPAITQLEYLKAIKKQVIANLTAELTKRQEEANKLDALLDDLKSD